jgi:hypothetical protein
MVCTLEEHAQVVGLDVPRLHGFIQRLVEELVLGHELDVIGVLDSLLVELAHGG